MQKKKEVSLLIRDGAGVSSILRIKSSLLISEQSSGLIKISIKKTIDEIPKDIGYLARTIFIMVKNNISRVQMISFRRHQIILDLGQGVIWTEQEEKTVERIIESLIKTKELTICWFLQREVGEKPKKIGPFLD